MALLSESFFFKIIKRTSDLIVRVHEMLRVFKSS